MIVRLITNRLRTSLRYLLHPGKQCGDPYCNISNVFVVLHDTIACTVLTGQPIRLFSLDFSSTFYRIPHTVFLSMLRAYGCNVKIIGLINIVYENAIAKIKINGHSWRQNKIIFSIHQLSLPRKILFSSTVFCIGLRDIYRVIEKGWTGFETAIT